MSVARYFIEKAKLKVLLNDFLAKKFEKAGYVGVDIQETSIATNIYIYLLRADYLSRRRGAFAELARTIRNMFNIESPNINIQVVGIENPALNAKVMAFKICDAIERGVVYRRAIFSAMHRIMAANARGCEIKIAGKLTSQRAKTKRYAVGYILKVGENLDKIVSYGKHQVLLKQGLLGVKVRIVLPEKMKEGE